MRTGARGRTVRARLASGTRRHRPSGEDGAMTSGDGPAARVPVLEVRGDHQALPGRPRQRRRSTSTLHARRGALPARRERRRQDHADERDLRALPARRGRDPARRASTCSSPARRDAIAAGIGMVHQHFQLIPVFTVAENVMLGNELRRGAGARPRRPPATASRSSASAVRALRRSRRQGRGPVGRRAAAGRAAEGARSAKPTS